MRVCVNIRGPNKEIAEALANTIAVACVKGYADVPSVLKSGEGRKALEGLAKERLIEIEYREDHSDSIVIGAVGMMVTAPLATVIPFLPFIVPLLALMVPSKVPDKIRVIDKSICECD